MFAQYLFDKTIWQWPYMQWLITFVLPIWAIIAAYMRFFMGRVYNPRLTLGVEAQVIDSGGKKFLAVNTKAKNEGNVRVPLIRPDTYIEIHGSKRIAGIDELEDVGWDNLIEMRVFDSEALIETGETIEDRKLFAIPSPAPDIYRVVLHVQGRKWLSKYQRRWDKNCTIFVI